MDFDDGAAGHGELHIAIVRGGTEKSLEDYWLLTYRGIA
jgi:hypothetical protein